jgi:hypothetical protein
MQPLDLLKISQECHLKKRLGDKYPYPECDIVTGSRNPRQE